MVKGSKSRLCACLAQHDSKPKSTFNHAKQNPKSCLQRFFFLFETEKCKFKFLLSGKHPRWLKKI